MSIDFDGGGYPHVLEEWGDVTGLKTFALPCLCVTDGSPIARTD